MLVLFEWILVLILQIFLKSKGVDSLQKILNNRCDAFEYLLDVYSNKYDLNKTVDLNAMINLFLNLINLSKVDTQKKFFRQAKQ